MSGKLNTLFLEAAKIFVEVSDIIPISVNSLKL